MRLPQRRDRIVRVYNRVYTDISFFWFVYLFLFNMEAKKKAAASELCGGPNQSIGQKDVTL